MFLEFAKKIEYDLKQNSENTKEITITQLKLLEFEVHPQEAQKKIGCSRSLSKFEIFQLLVPPSNKGKKWVFFPVNFTCSVLLRNIFDL